MEKYICDEQTIWLRDEDEAWSKVIELNCNLGRVIITDMLFGQFTQITYEGPTLVEQVKQFYAKLPACFNYWEVNYCPSSKGIVKTSGLASNRFEDLKYRNLYKPVIPIKLANKDFNAFRKITLKCYSLPENDYKDDSNAYEPTDTIPLWYHLRRENTFLANIQTIHSFEKCRISPDVIRVIKEVNNGRTINS